jgi:hypothetical protein
VLYRLIDREHACILIDEADNQDLPVTAALRAVINSGHHCDGTISRYLDGEEKVFSTFAPLALASARCPSQFCTAPSRSAWSGRQTRSSRGLIQGQFQGKNRIVTRFIGRRSNGRESAG